jgi:Protein of unknown function (DUF3311)
MSPSVSSSRSDRTAGARKHPLAWVAAGVLLLVAVAASVWVPIYARSSPKLGAFPFFYWYQLILVPAVAVVSWLAYLLVRPTGRSGVTGGRPPGQGGAPSDDAAPTAPEVAP